MKLEEQELHIQSIAECPGYMKNEAYVLKLLNKLETMGNEIIKSYSWEIDRKMMLHRDPKEY